MANDIEGLTSNEAVSQPRRPDLPSIEPTDRGTEERSGNSAAAADNSVVTVSSTAIIDVKSENQMTENDNGGSVPNGCIRHPVVGDGVGSPAAASAVGDKGCSFPSSSEPRVHSGVADDIRLGHDNVTADADRDNCSSKILTEKHATPESTCTGDRMQREFTEEVSNDIEENNTMESVTELFAGARISDDLSKVPSDAPSDEKLRAVGEEPHDLKRSSDECSNGIEYVMYESEKQMPDIMSLITKDLSEPYSIYTYRYFIHNWPNLCFLALHQSKCVGAIVCKLDTHKKIIKRGYIAMLAVAQDYRKRGIGSHLVIRAIKGMVAGGCDEVVLETEITNKAALHLYENLGFVRDKRLFRYYLNGVDALRLKLWLK